MNAHPPTEKPLPDLLPGLPSALRNANRRPLAIALGAFGLIHAGTLRFLRAVRSQTHPDAPLFAAILPGPAPIAAGALMREDERRRVLEAFAEIHGVGFIAPPAATIEHWVAAAPDALWAVSADEADVPAEVLERLHALGATVRAFHAAQGCTTREILARMTR